MANPDNWLETGYDQIAIAGVPITTQRSVMNLPAGSTAVDNPTTQQTDVTIPATPGSPHLAVVLTSSQTIAPQVDTDYYVESASAIVVTIDPTTADGVRLTFYDATQNWRTYHFTFVAESGFTVRNPWNIGATDASLVVFGAGPDAINGQSFTVKHVGAISKWLS